MRNSVCYERSVVPRPDRFNASRHARSGFTLIELMVIVMIISIISALAGPGMMRALAASRAQRAVYDLSRLARRARSEALTYGRAYMLQYRADGRGRFELWRGTTDVCRANAWGTIAPVNGCTTSPPSIDCADFFDANGYSSGSHFVTINTPVQRVCFEPDDDLWLDTGTGTFVRSDAGVRLALDRYSPSGGTALEQRAVLIPPGAAPRVER